MKLFKYLIIIFIIIFAVFAAGSLRSYLSLPVYRPSADRNSFQDRLRHALNSNGFNLYSQPQPDLIQDRISFVVKNPQTGDSRVTFSLSKDPYFQAASLQTIFKLATIDNKYIEFIDLSLEHPYATFKDH